MCSKNVYNSLTGFFTRKESKALRSVAFAAYCCDVNLPVYTKAIQSGQPG